MAQFTDTEIGCVFCNYELHLPPMYASMSWQDAALKRGWVVGIGKTLEHTTGIFICPRCSRNSPRKVAAYIRKHEKKYPNYVFNHEVLLPPKGKGSTGQRRVLLQYKRMRRSM